MRERSERWAGLGTFPEHDFEKLEACFKGSGTCTYAQAALCTWEGLSSHQVEWGAREEAGPATLGSRWCWRAAEPGVGVGRMGVAGFWDSRKQSHGRFGIL